MARPLVRDELWAVVAPLLPAKPPHPKGGPPFTVPDRAALAGIVVVLKPGSQWADLPQAMGGGSGMTCWRRRRAWQRAGVGGRLRRALLQRLAAAARIDWRRAGAAAARVPAKRGAPARARPRSTGASPGRPTPWWPPAAAARSPRAPRRPT